MFYGLTEYVAFVAVVGLVAHCFIRDYGVGCVITTTIGTVGNLAHETWAANFQVKPGWVVPLLMMGTVVALPVSLVIGVPHVIWRKRRDGRQSN